MDQSKESQDIYDVIIIGGGLSASNSAYILRKRCNSLKILVLEAKDRLGGRTHTIDMKCSKEGKKSSWDIGGQWVTHTQKNVSKLMEELNIETYRQYDDGKKMLESNSKISVYNSSVPCSSIFSWIDMLLYMKRVDRHVDQMNTIYPYANSKLAKFLDSKNLKEYLYSKSFTSTVRSIFTSNMRTIYGLELDQVNALFGLMYVKSGGGNIEAITFSDEGCAQEKRVCGGTQQISVKCLDYVAKNSTDSFTLLLNEAVVEINQHETDENEPVEVVTQNTITLERKKFKARKVISSIPPNQYIKIKFTPELPYCKRNLFKFCQVGNYMKFVVTYKTAFWREKGLSGEGTLDGSVMWLNEARFNEAYKSDISKLSFNKSMPKMGAVAEVFDGTNHEGEPALVGFIAGQAAVEWSDQSNELRKKEVIEDLARVYGKEARDYVDYVDKNWSNEPFSNGCPAFNITTPGVMKDYARALREPFLNLHFCGTETATEWMGYMDGAIQSGERVANEVLYALYFNDNENMNSIKIDYKKTYYYHRDIIKQIVENEERVEKRNATIQRYSKSILKYSAFIGSCYFIYKQFKSDLGQIRIKLF